MKPCSTTSGSGCTVASSLQIYSPIRKEDIGNGEQTAAYGPSDRSASLRVEGERLVPVALAPCLP